MYLLQQSMTREVFQLHRGYANDPYEFWKALEKQYESLSDMELAKLIVDTFTLSLSKCKDMDDYIKQKEDHHQRILASGGTMSQEYLCIALMAGLGSAYASLIDSLTKEELEKPMLMKAKLRESFKTKKYLTENKGNDSVYNISTVEDSRGKSSNFRNKGQKRPFQKSKRFHNNDSNFIRHGIPDFVISDNAAEFHSEILSTLQQQFNYRHKFTTPYHPQGNVTMEHFHKFLKRHMNSSNNFLTHTNWVYLVPSICKTPYFLMHGRDMRTPMDLEFGTWNTNISDPDVRVFREKLL
jgi:hypothetical protein